MEIQSIPSVLTLISTSHIVNNIKNDLLLYLRMIIIAKTTLFVVKSFNMNYQLLIGELSVRKEEQLLNLSNFSSNKEDIKLSSRFRTKAYPVSVFYFSVCLTFLAIWGRGCSPATEITQGQKLSNCSLKIKFVNQYYLIGIQIVVDLLPIWGNIIWGTSQKQDNKIINKSKFHYNILQH